MSENWKIQVSPKLTDGTLVNLRAETPAEAEQILEWAIANAAKIGDAVQAINAVSVVGAAFPGAQVQVEAPQAAPAPPPAAAGWNTSAATPPPAFAQQTAPAAPAAGEMCIHGAMKYQQSKPGAAKAWQAYFCPQPKGAAQCEPVWIR